MKSQFLAAVAIFACVLAFAVALPQQNSFFKTAFDTFKHEHGKVYLTAEEEAHRFGIFVKNVAGIMRFNNENSSKAGYKMGINQFADKTKDELSHLFGFTAPEHKSTHNSPLADEYLDSLIPKDYVAPDSKDWRQVENRVTPVKNQLTCGSCWAFATVGLFEGQELSHKFNVTDEALVGLSEQELVDCSASNLGCSGGIMSLAINDIAKLGGLEKSSDYPYVGKQTRCRFDRNKTVISAVEPIVVEGKNEELMKKLVAVYGPITVAIHASERSFMFYKSGVYYNPRCPHGDRDLDHAVLIVGYGTDAKGGDFWIVKNSWSEKYGEKGYVRMARNRNNHCGIAALPTIAKFD